MHSKWSNWKTEICLRGGKIIRDSFFTKGFSNNIHTWEASPSFWQNHDKVRTFSNVPLSNYLTKQMWLTCLQLQNCVSCSVQIKLKCCEFSQAVGGANFFKLHWLAIYKPTNHWPLWGSVIKHMTPATSWIVLCFFCFQKRLQRNPFQQNPKNI